MVGESSLQDAGACSGVRRSEPSCWSSVVRCRFTFRRYSREVQFTIDEASGIAESWAYHGKRLIRMKHYSLHDSLPGGLIIATCLLGVALLSRSEEHTSE